MGTERCSRCGTDVDAGDGYRAAEPAGERRAVFCRLEHVVPWVLQGTHWEPGAPPEPEPGLDDPALATCAVCGAAAGDRRVLLVRHRGAHRIPDAFCGTDHLREWASSGGRWG